MAQKGAGEEQSRAVYGGSASMEEQRGAVGDSLPPYLGVCVCVCTCIISPKPLLPLPDKDPGGRACPSHPQLRVPLRFHFLCGGGGPPPQFVQLSGRIEARITRTAVNRGLRAGRACSNAEV